MSLTARGLSRRYGARVALHPLDLTLQPGDRLAVVGPNGAGKTTLLSMLAGTLTPDAGELVRDGEVGWVPQASAVYGALTAAENLRLFARLARVPDVEATVAAMLERSGLHERAGERVERLSGGNRQRVNIAIGLLSDPATLVLDEPAAALDPGQRDRLWDWVGGLADAGTAIVFSSHDVAEVRRVASRVLVLADGRPRFAGTAAQLAARRDGDLAAALLDALEGA